MSQYITRDDCRDVEQWTEITIAGPDKKGILSGDIDLTVPLSVVDAINWSTTVIASQGFTIKRTFSTSAPSLQWKQRWGSVLLEVIGSCYHAASRNQADAQTWSSRAASFSQTGLARDETEARRSWEQCQQKAQNAEFYARLAEVLRGELDHVHRAMANDAQDLRMLAKLNVGGVL